MVYTKSYSSTCLRVIFHTFLFTHFYESGSILSSGALLGYTVQIKGPISDMTGNSKRLKLSDCLLGFDRFVLCALLGIPNCSFGQPAACVKELLALAPSGEYRGYQQRPNKQPDRCEGVYVPQKNAPPPVDLMSYTAVLDDFDITKDQDLKISWNWPAGGSNPRVRCYQLLRGTQMIYQMDASPDTQKLPYVWPLDLLRRANLSNTQLGLLAWAEYKTFRGTRGVYLPLEITRASGARSSAKKSPMIVLMPNRSLRNLSITVELLNSDLSLSKTLQNATPLKSLANTSNVPIRLDNKLLGLREAGFYSVTVAAEPVDSSNYPLPIFLYYAP